MYIYIYKKRKMWKNNMKYDIHTYIHTYIHISIYIYILYIQLTNLHE